MAIREIRKDGDEILRKISKKVDRVDEKTRTLLDDMAETMKEKEGVGLAAVQVGVLKRMLIVDIGEGVVEFINPEILSQEGDQSVVEGCLSIPSVYGELTRPLKIKVRAQNRDGEIFELETEGFMAQVVSHENDHLNGILFKDKVEKFIDQEEKEERRKAKLKRKEIE
jgi:peptide deformylase